jgi:hypothetical protein
MDQGAMMTYYYDIYGNVTVKADPTRETDIAPPVCPNGEQPNWTGAGWACIVFAAPQAPSAPPARRAAYDWYRSFTLAELTAIHTLANTDANVFAFMHVLEMSIAAGTDVVSNDPVLVAAMGYLQITPASAPCLTAARAAQQLSMK